MQWYLIYAHLVSIIISSVEFDFFFAKTNFYKKMCLYTFLIVLQISFLANFKNILSFLYSERIVA